MKVLIINNHSLHAESLVKLLESHEVSFADYEAVDYTTIDADVVILSGSHEHPFYSDSYAQEIEFIRNTHIPVLGVCLGCQLIAHTYGCGFYREEQKIEGVQQIKYIPTQLHYDVYEGHSFCINELSEDVIGVAASEYGYEIIRHAHKKQIGIQFHPEVNEPKNDGEMLFTTLLSEIIS